MIFSSKPLVSTSKCRAALWVAAGFSTVLMGGCATSPTSKVGQSTKVESRCSTCVTRTRA